MADDADTKKTEKPPTPEEAQEKALAGEELGHDDVRALEHPEEYDTGK